MGGGRFSVDKSLISLDLQDQRCTVNYLWRSVAVLMETIVRGMGERDG